MFSLFRQAVTLTHLNGRSEKHGPENVPAADLKMEAKIGNDLLAMFSPSLKGLLYHFDESREADLVDQGSTHDAGYAPHLRFTKLQPLKWDDQLIGGKLTIHYGASSKSDIVLESINIDGFRIEPQEGGTVVLGFSVQAHPNEREGGKLLSMVQQQIEITIEPPESEPN